MGIRTRACRCPRRVRKADLETVATKEKRERDVPMGLTIICNISSITYSYCLVVSNCLVACFVDFFLLNSLVHWPWWMKAMKVEFVLPRTEESEDAATS